MCHAVCHLHRGFQSTSFRLHGMITIPWSKRRFFLLDSVFIVISRYTVLVVNIVAHFLPLRSIFTVPNLRLLIMFCVNGFTSFDPSWRYLIAVPLGLSSREGFGQDSIRPLVSNLHTDEPSPQGVSNRSVLTVNLDMPCFLPFM